MQRLTVREDHNQWCVAVDGTKIAARPTRREARCLAHRVAHEADGLPPIEIETKPGVWRTIAP